MSGPRAAAGELTRPPETDASRRRDVDPDLERRFAAIRPGFPRERIFKVFERLDGRTLYPGSGVGLAIVQRAIEQMGGTVGVDSQPDNGSTFRFELPAAPARVGLRRTAATPAGSYPESY